MDTIRTAGQWISAHTNKVTEFARQVTYTLVLFHLVNWTPEQQIAAVMAISAFLAMFTESGTVSKVRMDERMEEKDAKVEEKVEQRVAQITGTGNGVL
jgi:hypothetical protein